MVREQRTDFQIEKSRVFLPDLLRKCCNIIRISSFLRIKFSEQKH